jgi:hypothetical protein
MKSQLIKKLLRRSGYAILALAALLAIFILEENLRGRIMLARYKAELRAKGEKLVVPNTHMVSREENESDTELGAAGRELSLVRKESKFDVSFATRLRWAGSGRAIARCRETDLDVPWREPPVSKGGNPRFQNTRDAVWFADWDDLGERLKAASNALTRVRATLTNGNVFLPDWSEPSESLSLGYREVESVRTWLAAAGLYEIHEGKLDSAIEEISLLATLARVRRDERLMQGYTRIGTGETGLNLTWEAL